MADAQMDAIESRLPPPTGDIGVGEALEILPRHIALIGGIEPVLCVRRRAGALYWRTLTAARQPFRSKNCAR